MIAEKLPYMAILSEFAVRRLMAALLATVVLIGLLAASAFTPMSMEEAKVKAEEVQRLFSGLTVSPVGIFTNNLLASLLMMIPAAGIVLAVFIVYNTGMVIAAISTVSNIPVTLSLAIPFLTFYGFVEMLAYGFAVSESFFMTYAAIKKRIRKEVRVFVVVVLVVAGLLGVAAVLEWMLISFAQVLAPS